jgi:hypothetical protein
MPLVPPFYTLTAKRKGLVKLFGGLSYPFYYTTVAVVEGQPMRMAASPDANAAVNDVQKMQPAVLGEGAKVFGLSLQITYDDEAYGQLQGYHFSNDTMQRLDGSPIGVLGGQGVAFLENYQGEVAVNEQLAVGPTGLLVGSVSTDGIEAGDKVPVWADTAGEAPAPIRIRFNFPNAGV